MSNSIAELEALLTADYSPLERGVDASIKILQDFGKMKFAAPKITFDSAPILAEIKTVSTAIQGVTSKTHVVKITADTTQAQQQITKLEQQARTSTRGGGPAALMQTGYHNVAAGGMLAASFTAPLALAGGASIKFAGDFQKSMLLVGSMTDVGKQNIAGLSQQILALSNDPLISKAPIQSADALQIVASKGMNAADSMKALRAATYGASAGLGEVKVIGKAATDVLSAYGLSADHSMEVVDAMTQAVKFGAGEVTQYASAFSKVIPLASQLGISYQEVFANIAQATKIGLTPSESVTGLRQALSNIIKPSEAATKAFKELKLSRTDLLASLQSKGLGATFEDLAKRSGGDLTPITAIFGSIRGLTEFLATSGKSTLLDYKKTLDAVLHPDGATLEAARTNAAGFSFQLEKLASTAQAAAIEIGTRLLPRLTDFVKVVGQDVPVAIRAWDTMPDSLKTVTIALGGLLALAGPLTSFVGLIQILGGLAGKLAAFTGLSSLFAEGGALGGLAGLAGGPVAWALIAAAVVAVAGGALLLKKNFADAAQEEENLRLNAEHLGTAFEKAFQTAQNPAAKKALEELQEKVVGAGEDVKKLNGVLKKAVETKWEVKQLGLAPGAEDALLRRIDQIISGITAKFAHLGATPGALSGSGSTRDPVNVQADHIASLQSRAAAAGIAWPMAPKQVKNGDTDLMDLLNYQENLKQYNAQLAGIETQIVAAEKKEKAIAEKAHVATIEGRMETILKTNPNNQKRLIAILKEYDAKVKGGWTPSDKDRDAYGEVSQRIADNQRKINAAIPKGGGTDSGAAAAAETQARLLRAQEKSLGEQASSWNAFAGQVEGSLGRIRQLEEVGGAAGEKTAKARVEAELLKRAYDGIPQPLKDSLVQLAAIEYRMNKMLSLRDGLRELFNGIYGGLSAGGREKFVAFASQFEKSLGQGSAFAALQKQRNALAGPLIGTSESQISSLRSQQEALSESQRKGAAAYGTSNGGNAKSLFEQFNLKSTVDMTCADVASKTVEALGFHLKKSMNAAQLERNAKAAGWVLVDPRTAPEGSLVFKPSASARSGVHAMMSLGDGHLASSSDHRVSYFDAHGNERAYAPPGGGTSYGGVPALNVRPVRGVNLPSSVPLDTRLLTDIDLPKSWGGMMRDYHAQPGEVTESRAAVEKFLQPYYAQLFAARKDLAVGSRAGKNGVPLSPEFMSQLRGDRATAAMLGPMFTDKALANDRSKIAGFDFDKSTQAVADSARQSIREMGAKIRLAATHDSPYAALLDGFKYGANQFLNNSQRAALKQMTLGAMVSDAREVTREARRQVSATVGANDSTAGLLGSGFNQGIYDRARFKAQKSNEIWNSDQILNLEKAGKGLEAARQGLMQLDLAMAQFDSDAKQGGLLAFAQQTQSQRESLSLLDLQIDRLREGKRTQQEINDELEIERQTREMLKALEAARPGDPQNAIDVNSFGAQLRSGYGKRLTTSALSSQQEYARQQASAMSVLAGRRQYGQFFSPDNPELDIKNQLLQKEAELKLQNKETPIDVQGRLKDYEDLIRGEQQLARMNQSKSNVIAAQNSVYDEQQKREEALLFTAKARLEVELRYEQQKRDAATARGVLETADEKAAREALDAQRKQSAAFEDAHNRIVSQAGDVRESLKGMFEGDFTSPLKKLHDELLDFAAGNATNAIFGKGTVDARPTGLLDKILHGTPKLPSVVTSQALNAASVTITSAATSFQSATTTVNSGTVSVRGATVNVQNGGSGFDIGSIAGFSTNGRAGSAPSTDQIADSFFLGPGGR